MASVKGTIPTALFPGEPTVTVRTVMMELTALGGGAAPTTPGSASTVPTSTSTAAVKRALVFTVKRYQRLVLVEPRKPPDAAGRVQHARRARHALHRRCVFEGQDLRARSPIHNASPAAARPTTNARPPESTAKTASAARATAIVRKRSERRRRCIEPRLH